ncbi:flagellar basal body P-ring formation chaperone FlgA [Thalassospiraceae bacterium LMO-JJ14]|nr:flagellar basal body P-ring formation chaperone FlgA [Thalassospiraceae bacterium LMO-JJ14]
MRKLLVPLIAVIAAGAMPAAAGSNSDNRNAPEMAMLKQAGSALVDHVVVDAKVIRLGDLFTNAGKNAEVSVAYAPDPGKRAVFDARWLYRVAHAYKINWQPLSARAEAVVERASISIPIDDIKSQILYALADQGVTEEMDIEFATRFQELFLPASADPIVRIENMNYQARTGRFSTIVVAGQGAAMERVRMTGRAFRTVEVPVLRSRVLRGDIITEANLEWVKMKAERVQNDVIVDASDLIGKTPKRGMRAGQPLRSIDVTRPVLVEKNSLVTIFHKVPNMILTAQGKALQNGADGDVVQIKNGRSNQVIEAEVVGPGRVAVRSLSQQISMSLN